ncbi:MAG: HYR domain-containing protein, partial [Bacteroidetes bacterium]
DCSHLGSNWVTLTVTDQAGNSATDGAFVSVHDTIPPTLTCPFHIEVNSCEPIAVDYPLPVAEDNCPSPTLELIEGLPSGSVFPLGHTEITYRAVDAAGNETLCSFHVEVISDLQVQFETLPPKCHGDSNGSITLDITGGAPPYSFTWDPPHDLNALPGGTYSFTITDDAGCTSFFEVVVPDPEPLLIQLDGTTPADPGQANGAAQISISGGTGSYTVEWRRNGVLVSLEEDPANLPAGDYLVVVSDENLCVATLQVLINTATGVQEPESLLALEVLPNPNTGSFLLHWQLERAAEAQVELFDILGRKVLLLPVEGRSGTLPLHLPNPAPGVYLLRFTLDGKSALRRVVVTSGR